MIFPGSRFSFSLISNVRQSGQRHRLFSTTGSKDGSSMHQHPSPLPALQAKAIPHREQIFSLFSHILFMLPTDHFNKIIILKYTLFFLKYPAHRLFRKITTWFSMTKYSNSPKIVTNHLNYALLESHFQNFEKQA